MSDKTIPIAVNALQMASKSRKEGYLEAIMAKSIPDKSHSGFILVSPQDYKAIGDAFSVVSGHRTMVPGATFSNPHRGLGDLVHSVAGPIGKAVKWPCLKGDGTTDLKPGSPCGKAKEGLNKAGEKISDLVGKAKIFITGS